MSHYVCYIRYVTYAVCEMITQHPYRFHLLALEILGYTMYKVGLWIIVYDDWWAYHLKYINWHMLGCRGVELFPWFSTVRVLLNYLMAKRFWRGSTKKCLGASSNQSWSLQPFSLQPYRQGCWDFCRKNIFLIPLTLHNYKDLHLKKSVKGRGLCNRWA